ncbi:DUF4194 domain-containing protein [Cytophagaceae bacterium ABcell3]|nr:DUF4194 domain-containing protein [Cytophagaceae bacterium ABcell3]
MKISDKSVGIPVIHLLKGILYRDQEAPWKLLLQHRSEIRDYVAVMGLELFVDEAEGYAFVRQQVIDEQEEETLLPKLVDKRPLSYQLTIMAVLLRKRLLESDLEGSASRLVLSFAQIADMTNLFYTDGTSNERRQEDRIRENINKLIKMGFLRKLKNEDDKYEVSRILNAFFTIDKLKETEEKLREYKHKISKEEDEHESGD